MDIQDVYNDKKQLVGISKNRNEFNENEFSMSTFIWITNNEGKLLVQQRSLKDDNKPGSYGITGGYVDSGENSLTAIIRETKEELGIDIKREDIYFVGSERRLKKFFEYYFIQIDSSKIEFNIDKNEVEKIEWIKIEDYEKNISNAINFKMFKNFYYNIYLK